VSEDGTARRDELDHRAKLADERGAQADRRDAEADQRDIDLEERNWVVTLREGAAAATEEQLRRPCRRRGRSVA
jgi:hypothetical protein